MVVQQATSFGGGDLGADKSALRKPIQVFP